MMEQSTRNRNRLILAAIVLVLLVVGTLAWIAATRIGRVSVEVVSVPSDARIYANGKRMLSHSFYVKPGEITIRAEKDGFETTETTVRILADQEESGIPIFLNAESQQAKQWVGENEAAYIEAESLAGTIAQQDGQRFRNANPIVNLLPYADFTYRIDYGVSPSNEDRATVKVGALGRNAQKLAIERIKEWGYQPTDLDIEFVNNTNPFLPPETTEQYGE